MSIVQLPPVDWTHWGAWWAREAIESAGFPSWDLTHPSHWGLYPTGNWWFGSQVGAMQLP